MIKTINQIKKDFEDYSNAHEQIKTFGYGQEFEQIGNENIIYPLMWVVPVSANLNDTTLSRVFRVIIADRVRKGEQNEVEVESDTQLICLDTLAYWTRMGENQGFEIGTSVSLTPFWEKWTDEVTGHFIDISIDEFYDYNSCSIPIDGSIPSGATCNPARITINDLFFGNAPSNELYNIVVKNQNGEEVGQIVSGEWIVPNGGGSIELSINSVLFKTLSNNYNLSIVNSNDDEIGTLDEPNNKVVIADSTISIKDENNVELYEVNIEAEGIVSQIIDNSTIEINKSDGTLITQRTILAEGFDSYNVADSEAIIKDSLGTTLKSENIKATETENITINNSTLNVQKSDGSLISARTILAEGTDSYNVADSTAVLKDEDGNTLSSTPIKATETTNITAPNGDVSVNNVAFDDVLSGGTLNIQVRKSTGNDLIGSKQGQYWRIGDSNIQNTDGTYNTNVKATENLTLPDSQINVNGVDEGDVVSVKTIDINIVDSVSAPVIPTSVGLVGNTLTIEVPSGVTPSGVAFDFPYLQQYTSYRTGDEGDRVQAGWNAITNPANPKVVAQLDTTLGANMYFRLKDDLVVGGVSSKIRYVDVLGGQTFAATNNRNLVCIDKLTGLMFTRTDLGSSVNWNTNIDTALTHSIVVDGVTYDDWYLISMPEVVKIFNNSFKSNQTDPISSATLVAWLAIINHTSTTTPNSTGFSNAATFDTANGKTITQYNKLSNSRQIYIRKAQSLITAP
jgi:hypothetical protein